MPDKEAGEKLAQVLAGSGTVTDSHRLTANIVLKAGYRKQPSSPPPVLSDVKERGRLLGISQCITFINKAHDQPTISEDIKEWVIPHGHKANSEITKFIRKNPR